MALKHYRDAGYTLMELLWVMAIIAILASMVLAAVVEVFAHVKRWEAPATHIAAIVSCSHPGMRFTGTIVCDGSVQKYSGTGTGTYHASGHRIVCSFKKSGADGTITLAVSQAGHKEGQSSTSVKFGGVRAEIIHTSAEQGITFTTY